MELRQKSLRDFIADAFAIKDFEITRLSLGTSLRLWELCTVCCWSRLREIVGWYGRRSVREGGERVLQIMLGIICYKKKKRKRKKREGKEERNGRERKRKRVLVEKIRIPRRLKLLLR